VLAPGSRPDSGPASATALPPVPARDEHGALRIAILGAESTGKTQLSQALAQRITALTGLRCAVVPEWLRHWCEREGRTPAPHEQAGIALHQHALIDQAAQDHDVVITDTTAIMTAVYSHMLFDDASLNAWAQAQQARCHHTLLTALDIAWQADGLQRDGPHVREPVDNRVRALLIGAGLPWSLVAGTGDARVESALNAIAPLLQGKVQQLAQQAGNGPRATGLFTRLAEREAASVEQAAAWRWVCENCDVPDCEHAWMAGRSV